MQAVHVRNEALLEQLREHPLARDCTVYCVENRFPIPRTMDDLFGWEWCYVEAGVRGEPRSYAYNGLPTIAVTPEWLVRQSLDETTMRYSLTGIDPVGKQGVVVVRPRSPIDPVRLGWKYLWRRHTARHRLARLIDQLVVLDFYPVPLDPARLREDVERPR
jgi:hypothetical protein